MANEFVIRNGFVSLNNSKITGSLDISGSESITGSLVVTNGITGSLSGTSSWSQNTISSSYSLNVLSSSYASSSTSASYAISSSTSISSSRASTSSYALSGLSSSYALNATSASYSDTSISSSRALTSSYSLLALTASFFSGSISNAVSSSYALTASYALNGGSGGGSVSGGTNNYITLWSGSNGLTSSLLYQSGTFIGDGTTTPTAKFQIVGSGSTLFSVSGSTSELFKVIDSNSSNILSISSASIEIFKIDNNKIVSISGSMILSGSVTSSLFGTSSWAQNAVSASYFSGSISNAISSSYAATSSWSQNVISSSYALTASYASNASTAVITIDVSQSSHGYSLPSYGFIPTYKSSSGNWVTASSAAIDRTQVAFITSIIDSNNLRLQENGFFTKTSHGLTSGEYYFLQDDGTISLTPDSQIECSVCYVIDNNRVILFNDPALDNNITGSWSTNSITASYVATASWALNAVTASYLSGSISNAVSSSYALTASYALNGGSGGGSVSGGTNNYIPLWSGSTGLTSSILYQSGTFIGEGTVTPTAKFQIVGSGSALFSVSGSTSELFKIIDSNSSTLLSLSSASIEIIKVDNSKIMYLSGSMIVSGSITSSLSGTASWALNAVTASYFSGSISNAVTATTASYALLALTASYFSGSISNAVTSSYAQTSSWAQNAISASYAISSSTSISSSRATTASYALSGLSSSYALTASYALNGGSGGASASYALTSSYSLNSQGISILVSQSAHGFAMRSYGFIPTYKSSSGNWVTASSAAIDRTQVAFITSIIDSNVIKIQENGFYSTSSHGLTTNEYYYLQDDGTISLTPDTQIDSAVCLVIDSNNVILFNDPALDNTFSGSYSISSSYAISSSRALTSSYSLLALTASYFSGSISNAVSSSYALTASYALNGGSGGGGSVSGGTNNYIPLWSGSNGLTSSLLFQTNSFIGLGSTNPNAKFQIIGSGSTLFSVSGSTSELFRVVDANNSTLVSISTGSVEILKVDNNKILYLSGSMIVSGSITGSFSGDGSNLTGVVASSSPGGNDQSIQFNDGGITSGSDNFTFNKTSNEVKLNGYITASILTGALRFGELTVAPTTNQNNYNPAGWNDGGAAMATTLRVSASADIVITGLGGGTDDRIAVIENGSTNNLIILEDQSPSSTASNRFDFRNPIFLLPGSVITLIYDEHSQYWRALSASGGIGYGAFFNQQEDFMGSIGVWGSAVSGTGASVQISTYLQNTTEKPMGMWQADTGTTATGRAHIGAPQATAIFPGSGSAICLTRLAVEALPTPATEAYQIYAGWHDAVGATAVTDGVYWQFDSGSSPAWQGASARASTRSTTGAAGPTVDLNYIWLGIYVNYNWSKACYFYSTNSISWNIAGTQSANMPSASNSTGFGVTINKTVGTTQRNVSIDYLAHRYDIQRG